MSDTELDILRILWKEGSALSRPEILAKMPDKHWNPNSIHQVLNSMMKKEALKVEGMVQCGRIYGHTYIPCITQEEYIAMYMQKVLPSVNFHRRAELLF
ncbi:MAG: BlaI/MecI/CopY family transcriptional regulator [Oscillospiraceae bacterium]|nr:BlaI/MecI/CopY family transcriptional regulator [Oscillospiraceae bacterium]